MRSNKLSILLYVLYGWDRLTMYCVYQYVCRTLQCYMQYGAKYHDIAWCAMASACKERRIFQRPVLGLSTTMMVVPPPCLLASWTYDTSRPSNTHAPGRASTHYSLSFDWRCAPIVLFDRHSKHMHCMTYVVIFFLFAFLIHNEHSLKITHQWLSSIDTCSAQPLLRIYAHAHTHSSCPSSSLHIFPILCPSKAPNTGTVLSISLGIFAALGVALVLIGRSTSSKRPRSSVPPAVPSGSDNLAPQVGWFVLFVYVM